MTNRMKTTTAALGGAVALASAAFAIGSQAGDGSATAASAASAGSSSTEATVRMREVHLRDGARGPGLGNLAEDLGVSEDKLRDALEAVRAAQAPKGDRREDHAAALAKALGKSAEDVEKAMQAVREQRENAFADALAKSLGIDAAKVRAALDDARPDEDERPRRGERRERFGDLAEKLGVSQARLRRALRDALPDGLRGGPGHRGGPRGEAGEDLAKALGVSADALEKAFEQVRDQHESEHAARRAAFVTALAKELGISEDKVREALPEGPFGGPGRGGHGRGPR
jgi:biotin operon repressor